jgi:polysaccharide biosynthesis PFTS motif protein
MILPNLKQKNEVISAYKFAETNLLISKIHGIKKEMYFQKIKLYYNIFNAYVFSTSHDNVQYSISQFFNLNLLNNELNKKILLSQYNKKRFSHPLPLEYILILKSKNININRLYSLIKYTLYVYKSFIFGFFYNLILLKNILFRNKPKLSINKAVFFSDLQENCIPFENDNNVYNIINWFISNNKTDEIVEIRHNINSKKDFIKEGIQIKSEINSVDYIQTIEAKLNFLFWTINAIFYNIFCLITFRLHSVLLYNEACYAKIYKLIDIEYLPKEIYFSISSFQFKPLWTYIAENKDIKVINYSYASSFQGFKTKEGYVDQEYLYDNTRWKNIYYWSEDYYNYVKSRVPENVSVNLVKPIYYSDSNYILDKFSTKYVGVFDVTPLEDYISCLFIPEIQYRNFKNAVLFLNDIYEAALLNNFILLWKRKRNFNANHSQEYIEFCLEFEKRKNIVVIDPNASAFKIIKMCKICVSMPFTSTGVIAKNYNINSIYYDPSGKLYLDDRGAQGIKVINDKNDLKNYFKNEF